MPKLGKYMAQPRGANILIYGPPKSGKTAMVAELANQGYHVHNIDIERGADVFGLVVDEANFDNVTIYSVPDDPSSPNAIKLVSKILDARGPITFCTLHGAIGCADCKKNLPAESNPDSWETIDITQFGPKDVLLVDSVTQLSNSAMIHSLGARPVLSTKKPEWDNYSAQGQLLDFVFAKAQASPVKTIFISHEEDLEQEDGSKKITPVGGTRNYSKNLSRFFGHVIYCSIKNNAHRQNSLTTENAKITAGNRYNLDVEIGGLAGLLDPPKDSLDAAKAAFKESRLAQAKKLQEQVAKTGKKR